MVKNKKDVSFVNYDTRLREFLMTTFLVVIVYELIAKIFWTFYFDYIYACQSKNIDIGNNIGDTFFTMKNAIACGIQPIINILPKWFFSIIPGANNNFLITIFSLFTTGILIGLVYKIAKFIYKHEDIKNYMQDKGRKELYTDEFGALLLLTFMIFGIIILILYPIFGIVFLIIVFKILVDEKNSK